MLGFTGEYQGKQISVIGIGMGIPSCSIYAKELITEYGAKSLTLTILTVSDHIRTHESTSSDEWQSSFNDMV